MDFFMLCSISRHYHSGRRNCPSQTVSLLTQHTLCLPFLYSLVWSLLCTVLLCCAVVLLCCCGPKQQRPGCPVRVGMLGLGTVGLGIGDVRFLGLCGPPGPALLRAARDQCLRSMPAPAMIISSRGSETRCYESHRTDRRY